MRVIFSRIIICILVVLIVICVIVINRHENYDIIQLLLEYGASIKIKNNKGITPFEVANKDIKDTFNLVEIYNNLFYIILSFFE